MFNLEPHSQGKFYASSPVLETLKLNFNGVRYIHLILLRRRLLLSKSLLFFFLPSISLAITTLLD